VPPPPELQPVTVDSVHTALLILDMTATICTASARPSCIRSIPHVRRLLTEARAHNMLVVYAAGPASSANPAEPVDALAPRPNEPMVRAGADKFLGSNLEHILAAGGITNVIVVGTAAQGAVLHTASGAALRGLTTIVPVDGFSSASPFPELYTAWHLKNGADTISRHVILTSTDLITLR
jgi:nicotinamidase-related amidase